MTTGNQVIRCAASQLGYSRWNDPAAGTKYGRWYAQVMGASYFASSGVPYCDMFVSWCLEQCGLQFRSAYVPGRINYARQKGWVVRREDALPGDLVCFDWDGDGTADHIGFVEIRYSWSYQTIEGNTSGSWRGSQSNGGGVYRRTRSFDSVVAVIRPPYKSAASPVVPAGTLAVDGDWGMATTRALQRINGTPIDGIISSQYAPNMQYLPACAWAGSGWQWEGESAQGSQLIAKLQKAFRTTPDGIAGPSFARGLQQYYKVSVDGYVGAQTVRAMQRAINRQVGGK